jgi:hypothetical protein
MLVTISTLALIALVGAIARQSWVVNGRTSEVVRLEAHGAEMLHSATTLLAELVRAQSAAVRAEPVDVESLRKALAGLSDVDRLYGAELQTTQRLSTLTTEIEAAASRRETGRAAYDSYSALVGLALELIRRIGDTSHLIHDPDLDSYYLMDAAIVRLPDAAVLAGRAADLVALAGGASLEGEDRVRAAVARFGVSDAAEQVQAGLSKSVEVTERSLLGVNITERLDAFKAAADAFAPPTMLSALAGEVDAATLADNASRVAATANPLAHRLLGELQALLEERATTLEGERQFTALSAAAAAIIGLVLMWLLLTARRRPAPTRAGADRAGRPDDLPVGSLAYARDILDNSGDLVQAGRTTRPRDRGRNAF